MAGHPDILIDYVIPANGNPANINGDFFTFILPPASVNPTHTHPRSAELLLIVNGTLDVGFVDTTNKLYTQDLATSKMIVFPKGMSFEPCIIIKAR
ncbi:hypothetical protein ABZP36_036119 [Zizania latifolia]